jgi:hypothetical protein
MRVLSKTKKPGTKNVYYYRLEARVSAHHDSVESKLGGVGAKPRLVNAHPPIYWVDYESNGA